MSGGDSKESQSRERLSYVGESLPRLAFERLSKFILSATSRNNP